MNHFLEEEENIQKFTRKYVPNSLYEKSKIRKIEPISIEDHHNVHFATSNKILNGMQQKPIRTQNNQIKLDA